MEVPGLAFERAWALLLLPPLIVLALHFSRTSLAPMPVARRRLCLALRALLIVLLVGALAEPGLVRASHTVSVVFLLDRSASMPSSAQAAQALYVRQALEGMPEGDEAGVVVFGAAALVDRPVSTLRTPPDLQSKPADSYTDIGGAIRLGLTMLPAENAGRLVLLSDGRQNLGDAEWAGRLAAANGVQLDVVSLESAQEPEVWVAGLDAPAQVREGERVTLSVRVASSVETTATLTLLVDGEPIGSQVVSLLRGTSQFVQQLPPAVRGFHTYSILLEAPPGTDTRRENNRHSGYSLVLGRPNLLLIEGNEGEAGALMEALRGSADVARLRARELPADLVALAGYDAVALVNVPASDLTGSQMEALRTYVRDLGKGLLVIGGSESYGAGGYFRTPLEDLLPVDLNLPSKLDIPTVAMVMVIDRSGSMEAAHSAAGGVKKIELAKEAASLAVAQLSDRDYAGVITFDSGADWVVKLQPLGDPAMFKERIGRITSGGGTNIYAGLSHAVDALVASKARSRHIVLLTDGVSEGGDYGALIERTAANKITLSTVAVGADADTGLMRYLAQEGKGNYYYTEDGNALPRIFAHESHLASRSYLVEHTFVPERASPSPILDGLGGLPALLGYVGTSPRPGGQLVLVSNAGDPILAQWQFGLGRVVAWTSDAKGQWGREWVAWSEFARFWQQATRWATATQSAGALQARAEVIGGTARVSVDAQGADGRYLNGLGVTAVVVAPDGLTSTLELPQVAAGRYEGSYPAHQEGAYLLHVAAQGARVAGLTQSLGMVVPYSPEFRGDSESGGLPQRLSELTGGRILNLEEPDRAFDHSLAGIRSTTPLWPLLVLLSALLLPFDIGVRRLRVSWGEIVGGLRRGAQALGGGARRGVVATQGQPVQIAAMMEAKTRARARSATGAQGGDLNDLPVRLPRTTEDAQGDTAPVTQALGRAGRSGARALAEPPEPQTERAEAEESLAAKLRRARERR